MKLDKAYIFDFISSAVRGCAAADMFREPLVGFSSARDPLYGELKHLIGEYHAAPRDILPSAETLISFFIPFAERIPRENRGGEWPTREWAESYVACNALINEISGKLTLRFREAGLEAETIRATHTYNPKTMEAAWSHKSAACIAGLGTFGVNRLIITRKGCAGRFGTVFVSAAFEPDARPEKQNCLKLAGGDCDYCVKSCPTGALTEGGIDKFKCHAHLLGAGELYPDLSPCDVCGKCAVGPCAVL